MVPIHSVYAEQQKKKSTINPPPVTLLSVWGTGARHAGNKCRKFTTLQTKHISHTSHKRKDKNSKILTTERSSPPFSSEHKTRYDSRQIPSNKPVSVYCLLRSSVTVIWALWSCKRLTRLGFASSAVKSDPVIASIAVTQLTKVQGADYCTCWWLVELPMWLTDGFSVTFFGRWRGQCAHTLIPVWLTCGSRTW